jgi:hypothetical protein
MKPLQDAYYKARLAGRLCIRCGWIVPKKNWLKGQRLCCGCLDALQGVNVSWGRSQPQQETIDKTGEML